MLDIGIQELLVIMILALLVFGPEKLPELGKRLGRAMREFRRASDEFRSTVEQNLQINADHDILPPSAEPAAATATAESVPATVTPGEGTAAAEANGTGPHGDEDLSEPFWASRGGRLLHRAACSWRGRVAVGDRMPIATVAAGLEQGLRPCPACDPKEAASLAV